MGKIMLLVAWIISIISSLTKNKKVLFFSFVILFIFSSVRYDFGNDYWNYFKRFYGYKNNILTSNEDIGYKIINKQFGTFREFLIFTSLCYNLTLYKLVSKHLKTREFFLAIMILLLDPYLFLVHLSAMRQTLALLFFIIGVMYLYNNNVKIYLICVIIASTIHISAIFLIFLPLFINRKKISKKSWILIGILLSVVCLTPLFNKILFLVTSFIPKYGKYIVDMKGNSLKAFIFNIFFFLYVAFFINKAKSNERFFLKITLIYYFIELLGFKLNMIARLGMYLQIFNIISFPIIIFRINKKLEKKYYGLIILIFFLFLFYGRRHIEFLNSSVWGPKFNQYKTIFNHEYNGE